MEGRGGEGKGRDGREGEGREEEGRGREGRDGPLILPPTPNLLPPPMRVLVLDGGPVALEPRCGSVAAACTVPPRAEVVVPIDVVDFVPPM